MSQPKVSVVIPVYNVEKYLNRCVASVADQTYVNLQIILVDDGSTDACPQICDEWVKKDSRVCVFHKHNEGQGIARNLGIQNAVGQYICFFDSDDYIAPDTIQKAVERAQETEAELVVFGLADVDASGTVIAMRPPSVGRRTYFGDAVQEVFIPEFVSPTVDKAGNRAFCTSSCVILYAMEVIRKHNWKYVSERDIISEDVYSLLVLFQHIKSVAVLPEALYYCCCNAASFSRKYWPDRYKKIRYFYQEAIVLCTQIDYNEKVIKSISEPFLSYTLGTLKQEAASGRPLKHRFKEIKKIIDDDVLQEVLHQRRSKRTGLMRSIIFLCMRNRMYWTCFILISARA